MRSLLESNSKAGGSDEISAYISQARMGSLLESSSKAGGGADEISAYISQAHMGSLLESSSRGC